MRNTKIAVLLVSAALCSCGSENGGSELETVVTELHCDLAEPGRCHVCPDLVNELESTRDVETLKGEENVLVFDSYQLDYQWAEELELASEGYQIRDVIAATVPPGGKYIECVPVLSGEAYEEIVSSPLWDDNNSGQFTSIEMLLTVFGSTAVGQEWSQRFRYRVVVGYGL